MPTTESIELQLQILEEKIAIARRRLCRLYEASGRTDAAVLAAGSSWTSS